MMLKPWGAWPLAAVLVLGCARTPRQAPPDPPEQPPRAQAEEAPKAVEANEAPWHGLTVDDLAKVEALSGAGRVRLPVPSGLWERLLSGLGSARKLEGRGLVGTRSPVLRFLRMDGTALTLDLLGRDHWVLVEEKRQTTLAPCPPLKQAAKVAFRLACASGADHITVARVRRREGGKPILDVVRTLKGSAASNHSLRVEGKPLPLPGEEDELCLAFLRTDAHRHGTPRFLRLLPVGTLWQHTDALEAKVRNSMPLPDAWGDPVGGLRMGLRARGRAILLGEAFRVEIAIQNVGERPITLLQHRMNIYDYYPHSRFLVAAPGGRRCELAKPALAMNEADAPLARTLQPGEVYIHTVRLSQWPAGTMGKAAFGRAGDYEIGCTYSVTRGGGRKGVWTGTLTAAPIRLRVLTPRRKDKDTGGPV